MYHTHTDVKMLHSFHRVNFKFMNEYFLFFLPQREKNNYMSPQSNTLHRPRWKQHRNSRKQDSPLSRACRCTWSRCLGKKEMQSPPYPCNYPTGQLHLGKNKVKRYTCKKTARNIGNDSVRQSKGNLLSTRVWVRVCLFVPCGSASTRAKTGTCSVSHSFLTISLLLTSGTPLPWRTHETHLNNLSIFHFSIWLTVYIYQNIPLESNPWCCALPVDLQDHDDSMLTVMMIHGDSLVQKSSSRSLWKVASFSTIRMNLADDTMSLWCWGIYQITSLTNINRELQTF